MTIREAVEFVDEVFPNTFSNERKTQWLSQCDAEVWTDVMLQPAGRFSGYRWAEDADLELIAPEAYEMMYVYWLQAQMHMAYQEIAEYTNAAQQYNHLRARFAIWYADTYDPAHGGRMTLIRIPTIRQGETATLVFTLPVSPDEIASVTGVLYGDEGEYGRWEKTDMEIDGMTAAVEMTSEETLALPVGIAWFSAVCVLTDGRRAEAQEPMKLRVCATALGGGI